MRPVENPRPLLALLHDPDAFEPRGSHLLKGIPEEWTLYAVAD